MEDDWGLQAVVRGYNNNNMTTTTTTSSSTVTMDGNGFSLFDSLGLQQQGGVDDGLLCFPDLEELEQLCRPFFPNFQQQQQQQIFISPISSPPPLVPQLQQIQQQQYRPNRSLSNPRQKRRKNQQKRVVCQVPAEGLTTDVWAWRKYGQKPIKGSPYPRGYYRCSSTKGCLARKQVERSRTDPAMFVVTYTSEHNHPVPTHRNSLAGISRSKPNIATATTNDETTSMNLSCSYSSPSSTLSPATPLMDEDVLQQQSKLQNNPINDDDDLFLGLEELIGPMSFGDDCFVDQFPANFNWFTNNNAATTAAGGGS
ncbi:hypothetical protein GIB67_037150 [Kingdonia uniflora]|uniref:WRKY domain-containing protein n=1 Tax=Kingdonia uniflora TaxID=39325 RepID=A0A7J7MRX6_9MAGN|nr:hypothetical protein GIB67_037150 [Kingdonia uniflora]